MLGRQWEHAQKHTGRPVHRREPGKGDHGHPETAIIPDHPSELMEGCCCNWKHFIVDMQVCHYHDWEDYCRNWFGGGCCAPRRLAEWLALLSQIAVAQRRGGRWDCSSLWGTRHTEHY